MKIKLKICCEWPACAAEMETRAEIQSGIMSGDSIKVLTPPGWHSFLLRSYSDAVVCPEHADVVKEQEKAANAPKGKT